MEMRRRGLSLGDVQGFGVGGSHVSHEMQLVWARSDVLARAAERGATHVVFVSERTGSPSKASPTAECVADCSR